MEPVKSYNWNELPRDSPRHGIERVGFRGDNAMVVVNWLSPDLTPNPHSHPFEQVVLIVQGRARFHIGADVIECGPGSMVRVPPDVVHWAETVGDEVCLNIDVFSPVREDYRHLVAYQAAPTADRP